MCETFRDRRRRHHRDHGWPQAADTPSSFFRTSHPPNNTDAPHNTQQSREAQDRGTPGQMNAGARTAIRQARAHFAWVLRSSRQVGAGSRGRVTTDGSPAPHQKSVMSQNSGAPVQCRATQPRPCARADTTRPATANYPPGLQRAQHDVHPITVCTSHHHIITYYIARTDRADGCSVTRHWKIQRCRGAGARLWLVAALCVGQTASHNTQILACFPRQLDGVPFLKT